MHSNAKRVRRPSALLHSGHSRTAAVLPARQRRDMREVPTMTQFTTQFTNTAMLSNKYCHNIADWQRTEQLCLNGNRHWAKTPC